MSRLNKNPIPGAVIAIKTFGDVLGFNPHCHILGTDGCFYSKGMFRVAPPLELKKLEAIFLHKVFYMLITKGRTSREMVAMLSTWRHSGFNVFCGNRIQPKEEETMTRIGIASANLLRLFSLPSLHDRNQIPPRYNRL